MDAMRDTFVTGLKNAHAMEKQALSIMQPQLARLEHYPDVSSMLERHVGETGGQIDRLERILGSVSETSSSVKDMFLSAVGSMAALGHVPAQDEILKNSMANLAFENCEIAAYTTLITMAQESGETAAVDLLEQSLDEEKRMSVWIADTPPAVTRTFLGLQAGGMRADV
ncbi:ferritin-like domain-containing protein [Cereibacter sphaeroides]|uniref:ferritin-like domain-containing protein n=1 Tax=Cereibacter sphaeroides TaxID=1063 RepID=UPI001F1AB8EA|nr:ferritin-like domain-containing protein [Cereibacter sphaeroides]MCE6949741.1 ferritin-like domain-containing protein [Cereibacter sphaeroides]